ncbi:MAG: DUF2330 domain-containing protein [Myxococcales bacterium]|nr:DUF2330 domain-containing protein [Myxococcales bacterium]MDD9970732.1 DUF2330 domain-containing protein [Myxococcales bacterium]
MMRERLPCAALVGMLCLSVAPNVFAVCRVVEPVEERGGVVFDLTTMVLFALADDQVVGHSCQPIPELLLDPGDPDGDAGTADEDAGLEEAELAVAAEGDVGDDGCPSGERLVAERDSVVQMVVQPQVFAWGGSSGLVMPVPARPEVHVANRDLFEHLGALLIPREEHVVEEVEDESLGYQCRDPKFRRSGGCLGGGVRYSPTPGVRGSKETDFFDGDDEELSSVVIGAGVVRFKNTLTTDEYDATLVNASTPEALFAWLDDNGFKHDEADDEAFSHYVGDGAWFVALRVHPPDDRGAHIDLEPVVVSFRGKHVPLMHRLAYEPRGGRQITEAFVLARSRMEAADDSSDTLYAAPAHFGGAVSGFGISSGWITHLRFDRDVSDELADSRLVPSFAGEVRPTLEVITTVRIPSSECPDAPDTHVASRDGCDCAVPGGSSGWAALDTFAPVSLVLLALFFRGNRRGPSRSGPGAGGG